MEERPDLAAPQIGLDPLVDIEATQPFGKVGLRAPDRLSGREEIRPEPEGRPQEQRHRPQRDGLDRERHLDHRSTLRSVGNRVIQRMPT